MKTLHPGRIFTTLFCLFAVSFTYGQNIGINSTGTTPNASAILDLNTGNTFTSPNGKGMLVPNVVLTSTTDAITIASPSTSLLVYNTATAGTYPTQVTPGYYYNSGTPASPVWTRFAAVGGTTGYPYENRFLPGGSGCGAGYYVMNSSNYGPGTFGDNTNPYANSQGTYFTTTPATIPAYYGVWYVSYTASATVTFTGFTGWGMVENQYNYAVNTSLTSGSTTVTLYFYKYTPTAGNTGNISGTLLASGSFSTSKTFIPQYLTFSPATPVTLAQGDIIIGYAVASNCPYVSTKYSVIDIMGVIQFQ